jgi:hypothetical protein
MKTRAPGCEEVREALDRVLSSPTFARAGALSNLLRHVVDKTTAGCPDGRRDETHKIIAELTLAQRGNISLDCEVAAVWAALGGRDRAFITLDRAAASRAPPCLT